MQYNKISATNNKREMGQGEKIKWLITVWELQVQSKPKELRASYDIVDLSYS